MKRIPISILLLFFIGACSLAPRIDESFPSPKATPAAPEAIESASPASSPIPDGTAAAQANWRATLSRNQTQNAAYLATNSLKRTQESMARATNLARTPTRTPSPTLTPGPSPTPDLGAMQETTTSFTSPDGERVMTVARALPLDDQGELYADYGHDRVEVSSSDGTKSWTVVDEWFTLGLGLGGYEPYLWTPDGEYLYIAYVPIPDGCGVFVNGSDLRKVDLGNGEVTQIVPHVGLWLSLSPDENTLAYIGYARRGLVLRDLETGQERQVNVYQSGDEAAGHVLWSPDGSTLVLTLAHQPCTTNWATSTSILRVNAETLEVTPLIEQDERLFITVEWSRPDQVILKDKDGNLWTMDPGTGEAIPQK